jgi:hypothetical protein
VCSWSLLSGRVYECDGDTVCAWSVQPWRTGRLLELSRRSVRCRVSADEQQLQRSVLCGVCVCTGVDRQYGGGLQRGSVLAAGRGCVHGMCGRSIWQLQWAVIVGMQWAVCGRLVRQCVGSDTVHVQRSVSSGVRLSRGVCERDGGSVCSRVHVSRGVSERHSADMCSGSVQQCNVEHVCAVHGGVLRQHGWCHGGSVFGDVCGWALWQQRRSDDGSVYGSMQCGLHLRGGVCEQHSVCMSRWQIQSGRRGVVYAMCVRSIRVDSRADECVVQRAVRRRSVRQQCVADGVEVRRRVYGGVLLRERVDVGYVPGVSAGNVQLVGVERVRELQRGSVREHDGTVNGWVHAWM